MKYEASYTIFKESLEDFGYKESEFKDSFSDIVEYYLKYGKDTAYAYVYTLGFCGELHLDFIYNVFGEIDKEGKTMNNLCIGLFGTCGNSTWRKRFVDTYIDFGYEFFNPQKDDWNPEDADIEAKHLKEDLIIAFPVLAETYGLGSLAEIGFSVVRAIENADKHIIILIDSLPEESLKENSVLYKESKNVRALVKAHLSELEDHPNIHIVETLQEMLKLTLDLYSDLR